MPSAFPGIDPYLEEPSQWVLFACLHDRFHDLVYQLRLMRKHFLTRIPSCLSFAQLADDLLDHFFHPCIFTFASSLSTRERMKEAVDQGVIDRMS